ncbi:hypothetical protein C8R42DRAFT_71294 [Lentinula raphanica]|nr:hypothetical protein C8R42DRAFT_71294 [Lentinula raphanica]
MSAELSWSMSRSQFLPRVDVTNFQAGIDSNSTGNMNHHPNSPNTNLEISPAVLEALSRQLQNATDESKDFWRLYQQVHTLADRLAISFVVNLLGLQQRSDNLNESLKTSSLKKILRERVKGYLLAPTTTCYIKGDREQIIINAMRAERIRGLPDDDGGGLKKYLAETFTLERSRWKSEIVKAATTNGDEDQDLKDIGTLARTLIGNSTSIPITLALIQRIALIRKVVNDELVSNGQEIKQRGFWPLVDEKIAELMGFDSEMPKSREDIESAFNELVDEDIRKYGKPKGVFIGF